MGISGLLPFVKAASSNRHISYFRGQTAAVDSYCWLHKGAFGCADKLVKGEETNAYIAYCFKYIDMLLHFQVKPVMVFDGRHLPAKLKTEQKRQQSRKLARKRAIECLKLGKTEEARAHFQKCVDITPEMALALIKECRKKNIDCIVAPYEADAQLAYLNLTGIAHFIISEDSDLLPFGCSNVFFKLDATGSGILVESNKLHLTMKERPDIFSLDRFRYMCILSGCDYLDSLPGIGLKKALKFLKRVWDCDIYESIPKLPAILNMRQLSVTNEYREEFMIADATFRHQVVFDPLTCRLVPLTDPVKCGTKLEYCGNAGEMLDENIAFQLAIGNVNPFNFHTLDHWCPHTALKSRINASASIWSKSYKPVSMVKKKSSPAFVRKTSVKVNVKSPEKQLTDDDSVMKEQLWKIYSTAIPEEEPSPKKVCIRQSDEEDTSQKRLLSLSPILSRKRFNPFIKNSTEFSNENNQRVISKYFSSDNHSDTDESNVNNIIVESELDEFCNKNKVEIFSNASNNIIVKEQNIIENEKASGMIVSKYFAGSTTEIAQSFCEIKKESKESIGNKQSTTFSNSKSNVTNINGQILIKKSNNFRKPGLSKPVKFKLEKNQPTILKMFGCTQNSNL